MSLRGLPATMTIKAATDGDNFRPDVEQVLCPALRPSDVVVIDNPGGAHKATGLRELIQAAEPNCCTCRPIPTTRYPCR